MTFYHANKEKIDWVFDQHRQTNHLYDSYLPYEFHLRLTLQIGQEYKWLLQKEYCKDDNISISHLEHVIFPRVELGLAGHDLIENTNVSYNTTVKKLGCIPADMIFALADEKGKTRKEKHNDKYYHGILDTEHALYGKLCDRIANCRYSLFTMNNDKLRMYKHEHLEFMAKLKYSSDHKYEPMFAEISDILFTKFKETK